jgi:hypothetical protein
VFLAFTPAKHIKLFPTLPSKVLPLEYNIAIIQEDVDSIGKYKPSNSYFQCQPNTILVNKNLEIVAQTPAKNGKYYYDKMIINHINISPNTLESSNRENLISSMKYKYFLTGDCNLFPEYNLLRRQINDSVFFYNLLTGKLLSKWKTNVNGKKLFINPISCGLVLCESGQKAMIYDIVTKNEVCEYKGKYPVFGKDYLVSTEMILDLKSHNYIYFDNSAIPNPIRSNTVIKRKWIEFYTYSGSVGGDNTINNNHKSFDDDNDDLSITRVSFEGRILENIRINNINSKDAHILGTKGDHVFLYYNYKEPERRELIVYEFRKNLLVFRQQFNSIVDFLIIPVSGEQNDAILITSYGAILLDLNKGNIKNELNYNFFLHSKSFSAYYETNNSFYYTKPRSVKNKTSILYNINNNLDEKNLGITLKEPSFMSIEGDILNTIGVKGRKESYNEPWNLEIKSTRLYIPTNTVFFESFNVIDRCFLPSKEHYEKGFLILATVDGLFYLFNTKTGILSKLSNIENNKQAELTFYKILNGKIFISYKTCKPKCWSKLYTFDINKFIFEKPFTFENIIMDVFSYEQEMIIFKTIKGIQIVDCKNGNVLEIDDIFPIKLDNCILFAQKGDSLVSLDLKTQTLNNIFISESSLKQIIGVSENACIIKDKILSLSGDYFQQIDISSARSLQGNSFFTQGDAFENISNSAIFITSVCATFTISSHTISDNKLSFIIKNNTESFENMLNCSIYLYTLDDQSMSMDIVNINTDVVTFNNLIAGEEKSVAIDLKRINAKNRYLLIIESNALMDTRNSSQFNLKKTEPLFDGISISLEEQKSIIVLPLEK